ncbi:WecB/TagA/CpsF family glycosyltransferase [Candidatus Parcubacteria bacterium]|jgi:N-acetylglucosaminyldiphosphoundecaprenol N-acetyl-beta-D-mannosaminyltransferase|nr:WecB/TagA/CpsF family glycosyltransferase [Candidatus Parcubacteria bacterium]MBT7228375.1 WecB/TagA/CpsF family glycosyltransferase [Candidatus Parcubacteria bacterium]
MKTYKLLGVKIQTCPNHVAKDMLQSFLSSDSQHQIMTVNPEFIVASRENKEFKKIINESSLATIDGAGIIKALQFLGSQVSLDDRLTGVRLTEILINIAINKNYKILFCLYSKGLTKAGNFFMTIKQKYPHLDFQVADEKSALEKAKIFEPHIILAGYGAPRQDMWIYENLPKLPSIRVAAGVGGTFDFMSGTIKRAPKIFRSLGLEWLWRLLRQPWRIQRINRAVIIFPILVLLDRFKK